MKRNTVILSLMLIVLAIFIAGCISNKSNTQDTSTKKDKDYLVTTLQDYDSSLCSGSGTITGGYEYIGLKLQAYDSESGEIIKTEREYFRFPEQFPRPSLIFFRIII